MATDTPTQLKVLRRGEAAERLGVHPNTLAGWVQRGWLRHQDAQRRDRYRVQEVEALRERIYAQ